MRIKTTDYKNFINITKDILFNEDFLKLKEEYHHGNTNRYDHSIRVALNVYKISKNRNMDYISATRGALLHDFFLREEVGYTMLNELTIHSEIAVKNAIKKFNINEHEQDIIRTHMYPITNEMPKTKEALLVSAIDKKVSIKEGCKYNILRMNLQVIDIEDIDLDKYKLKEKEILNIINAKAVS